MEINRIIRYVAFFVFVATGFSSPVAAEPGDAPYGTAKFSAYSDIDDIKQLKVVWDFNFTDPKAVGIVFNYVSALLTATSEFGPHEIDPIKVVIVSHGPELVVNAIMKNTRILSIGRQVSRSRV